MGVKELKVREEVGSLEFEPAVDLASVVKGEAPSFMLDPVAFFERTHLTDNIKTLIIKSLMNILGLKAASIGGRKYEVESSLIVLPSEFGGGKTHSLILLYHVFSLINSSESREEVYNKLRVLDTDIAEFASRHWGDLKSRPIKVVVVDCKISDLAPSPVKPIRIAGREIKTIWGYLGYELGRYEHVGEADKRETAPYADDMFRVLNESRALVLIDEIGRYYDESGLPPTVISAFLMNLAEALSRYTVREVSVVISLPYEVVGAEAKEAKAMKYVHREELVQAINKVLSRPHIEIIKPVERRDLAEILRKRIFAHSREEFKKFSEEYIAEELNREYPTQVRAVLDDRRFWSKVRETYPFHPAFLDVLEKLAYKLPHLQKTRDAIRIAVQTVLAIKEGLYDWLEDDAALIMPYHIPLFVDEALTGTLLRNAPRGYNVFRLVLRSNVAAPHSFEALKKMARSEVYERVLPRHLRSLREEDARTASKLASIIWLHSLVGLGLPINMGDYPTTADLVYSVSPTEQDVRGVLDRLRVLLPQLVVHGDPESDAARWFFANVPSIEELIEMLRKNIPDDRAKSQLAQLLEEGLKGKRGRGRPPRGLKAEPKVFTQYAVVRRVCEVQKEVLESSNPVAVAFADTVDEDTVLELLKGRNNVVVLAPYIEGYDGPEELSPEDVRGIGELAYLELKTCWEALVEMLKYYIAVKEYVTEKQLRKFASEKIGGEELAEDILNVLKTKVSNKEEYYYRQVWNLINRVYQKVYYYRLGELKTERGLSLETDRPILPILEDFLKEKGLVPESFTGEDLLSVIRDYLGKDPEKEVIRAGDVWHYIRTTDKANVPIISYTMFVEAVKDLVKSLNYVVRVGKTVLWKPIYESESEADKSNDGEALVKNVSEVLRKTGKLWDDVELVYYKNAFEDWVTSVLSRIPKDKAVKVKRVKGDVLDLRDVLRTPDPKSEVKAGKLFYEKKKYVADIAVDLPTEIWEKRKYTGRLKVAVEGLEDEIEVKIDAAEGFRVEPSEFKGRPPLDCAFTLATPKAGDYEIRVEVYRGSELLETRTLPVSVKGEWKEYDVVVGEEGEPMREGVKVLCAESSKVQAIPDFIRILERYRGRVEGLVGVKRGNEEVAVNIKCRDPSILKLLMAPLTALARLPDLKTSMSLKVFFEDGEEPELREVVAAVSKPALFKFRVKERAGG